MPNNMKGVNTAIATVKKVAKQGTKVVAAVLPVASIFQNALEAHGKNPSDHAAALEEFMSRFHGIDRLTGKFSLDRAMLGTGRLVLAGLAGWAINQVT